MVDDFSVPVSSLSHLLAVAAHFERQAADGYALVARNLAAIDEQAGAALFRQLSEEEHHHAAQVAAAMGGAGAPPLTAAQLAGLPQDLLNGFGREEFELLISPYRALAAAVRREERAFSFYSQVSAFSETPDVSEMAEKLAAEELEHAALFRQARRRAYHVARREAETLGCPDPREVNDLHTLELAARSHETRLRRLLDDLALSNEDSLEIRLALAQTDSILALLGTASPDPTTRSAEEGRAEDAGGKRQASQRPESEGRNRSEMLRQTARAFDFYDQVFSCTQDEPVMTLTQALSRLSMTRAQTLRGWMNVAAPARAETASAAEKSDP